MKFRYWRGDVFRRITAISALVASLLFTTTASAALLSALLEGETITVQDKVFSNFSYSSTGTESQFQSAAAIVVSGFVTANGQVQLRVDLNASVRWELGLPAQSATGILAFDVDVLGSMELIEAVRVTSVFDTSPGGSAEMFVEFEDADSSHFFGFLHLLPTAHEATQQIVPNSGGLHIISEIALEARPPSILIPTPSRADLRTIVYDFAQASPFLLLEPSSIVLFGVGLAAGLGITRMRRPLPN